MANNDNPSGPTPEEIARMKEMVDLQEKMNKLKEGGNATARASGPVEAGRLQRLQDQADLYAKLGDSYDARVIQLEQAKEIEEENLRIINDQIAKGEIQGEQALAAKREAEENLKIAEHTLAVQTNTTEAIKEGRAAAEGLGSALGGVLSAYGEHQFFNTKNMGEMVKAFRAGDKALVPFIMSMGTAAIGSFINSLISLVFQVDEAESAFKRNAGASDKMSRQMTNNWEETRKYGVELKEMSATMTALKSTYTDFTMLNEAAQKSVAKTGALLAEVGFKNEDFAKSMQLSTKAFGQTAESAGAAMRDIADFANVIGVVPGELGAEFAGMGNSLAKMGDQGIRAFKDLAIVSKTTGLEMKKILAITDKFDTFEGAAEQAGKLNAALGGNFVNAMDLMTATDPSERFEMIRSSILDTGLTFDDMSYYQRKFYTDALGLGDVSDLALMLSGDMSTLAGTTRKSTDDYKKLAQRTKDIQSITEKFKTLMGDMIPTLTKVVDEIREWFEALKPEDIEEIKDGLKDFADMLVKVGEFAVFLAKNWDLVILGWITWKALKAAASMMEFGNKVKDMAVRVMGLAKATNKGNDAAKGSKEASESMAEAIKNVGEAAKGTWKEILALGGAVLLMGAGIAIAALGVAELVKSFGEVGDNAGMAVLGIIAFMVVMAAMIYLFLTLAPAAAVAAGPLLALGAAIFLVGAGVAVAAWGIGEMAKGFAVMFEAIEVDKLAVFGLFIALIAIMAIPLAIAAASMLVLTASFAGLGIAMLLFPTSDLEKFTAFFDSIGSIEAANLLQLAHGIKKINLELEKMPEKKATALSATMEMAATTQVAGAIAGTASAVGSAIAGIFGGGGKKDKVNVKVDVGDVLLDGDVVGKFVKKTMGEVARDSVRGTA